MSVQIKKEYYVYSNGVNELKSITQVPENGTIAKTEAVLRSITGPVPREDLYKLVQQIPLQDPNWQAQMEEILSQQQFVVKGIHANFPLTPAPELSMGISGYVKSYFNWKTAGIAAASACAFVAPSLVASYSPKLAEWLHLPAPEATDDKKGILMYSWEAWKNGAQYIADTIQIQTEAIPVSIKTPVCTYLGYRGLETLVQKAIEYPATDYKTWTALNLQKYLQDVYPEIIPSNYQTDAVLQEVKSPDGIPVRSPFRIDHEKELGRIYEEHVLKKILFEQTRLNNGKMFCPVDGTTPLESTSYLRDEALSDRIELRLLLLDAHQHSEKLFFENL